MKLTTKARYAVRAILELAMNHKDSPGQIRVIAKKQQISIRYLENLFTALRAAGILTSNKGKGGGFLLARPPQDINLLDIIQVVEGKISLVECAETKRFCRKSRDCVMQEIWQTASINLMNYFRSITLFDLMQKQKLKEQEKS